MKAHFYDTTHQTLKKKSNMTVKDKWRNILKNEYKHLLEWFIYCVSSTRFQLNLRELTLVAKS